MRRILRIPGHRRRDFDRCGRGDRNRHRFGRFDQRLRDDGSGHLHAARRDHLRQRELGDDDLISASRAPASTRSAPRLPLPAITKGMTIDGYTQPGASANTNGPTQGTNAVILIELDGTNTGIDGGLDLRTGSDGTVDSRPRDQSGRRPVHQHRGRQQHHRGRGISWEPTRAVSSLTAAATGSRRPAWARTSRSAERRPRRAT